MDKDLTLAIREFMTRADHRYWKNKIGDWKGYGKCMRCKDSWYWKQADIGTCEIGMFPICDECWEICSVKDRHMWIDALAYTWFKDTKWVDKQDEENHKQKVKEAHLRIDGELPVMTNMCNSRPLSTRWEEDKAKLDREDNMSTNSKGT